LPELLDEVEREPVQGEVSAVWILFELFGFLLSHRAEALLFLLPLRGAEAPLFHVTICIQEFLQSGEDFAPDYFSTALFLTAR
jgi:hypothetical protein